MPASSGHEFEQVVLESLAAYYTERLESVSHFEEDLRWILEHLCESPVERVFLVNLVRTLDPPIWIPHIVVEQHVLEQDAEYTPAFIGHHLFTADSSIAFFVKVVPQASVRLDRRAVGTSADVTYRVDFLIEIQENLPIEKRIVGKYVIEIDGHEFHEKMREQAQKDKERDRRLIISGYKVLRYTGSEVVADQRARSLFAKGIMPHEPFLATTLY